jgi:hypothetical protein
MKRLAPLGLCLLALSGAACRKKTFHPFYELQGQQDRLITANGDDAYLSPELEQIITALGNVPDETVEKERAVALVTHLKAEQARVRAARAPKPPPPAARPPWGSGARSFAAVEWRPDPACLNDCDAKAVACLQANGCQVRGVGTTNNGRGEVRRSELECVDAHAAEAACAEALRCNQTCKPTGVAH